MLVSSCQLRPKTTRSRQSVPIMVILAIVLGMVGMGLTPQAAEAATIRPGAKAFQIDFMLDEYETEQARRSFWAATVICWNSGIAGKALAIGVCQSMVSVCAAQAYYSNPRKRGAFTFTPWGQAWCWKY